MSIAVIGWGSLIWCPGALSIASRWRRDGPLLPVEFTRVSKDGRLTLVITRDVPAQRTLWASSGCLTVEDAAENLRVREGRPLRKEIGAWSGGAASGSPGGDVIKKWCLDHGVDGAVWTALGARDSSGKEREMTADQAVAYLRGLRDSREEAKRHSWSKAEEYVRSAPAQIDTPIRRRLRAEFGWADYPLAPVLFEPP